TSFDSFRIRTDDPAFAVSPEGEGESAAATSFATGAPAIASGYDPLDVNRDGYVSPLDALMIINELNSRGEHRLLSQDLQVAGATDTNGDGYVTPLDALLVINYLNAGLAAGDAPEGESDDSAAADSAFSDTDSWWLSDDVSPDSIAELLSAETDLTPRRPRRR
ncbi:MAG TPA: dockerin type I domain-containing protein, partial [Pirellulaceae bacterium]|nr:dockerin type I domain-containing protein [Pirellulaceae bacterium]